LINACKIKGKKFEDLKVVVNGAGAAGIACMKLIQNYGAKLENCYLVDSKGVVYEGRTEGMNPYKSALAPKTDKRTLEEACEGADVLIGVSKANLFNNEALLNSMNSDPIIFAMANPNPEVTPSQAKAIRPDCIVATGRSDYAN